MRAIFSEKIPIKIWLSDLEEGALKQAKNLANLPFSFHHVAIMPDAHQGYGMPIGGVLATKEVIIPNAVGVDIGCGMCALKTNLTAIDPPILKKIMGQIREVIPLGFKHHSRKQDRKLMPKNTDLKKQSIVQKEYENALMQIGTLGGGNHFIEIQRGNDGFIWIMIHSGSRNFGLQIAQYYNKLARKLNTEQKLNIPLQWDLAFLTIDSREGKDYIREMQYCVDFALANRKLMMDRIVQIFEKETKSKINLAEIVNIAHNYAALEEHFGQKVWVHRKGATLAKKETIGIIPGSQGSKSYIVKGKGNLDSFNSCSHGAGRRIGRHEAQKTLNLAEEIKKLDDQNIIHAIRHKKDLDEAPGVYKNIDAVMKNQEDLVEILVELQPLAVIKG